MDDLRGIAKENTQKALNGMDGQQHSKGMTM
jgi:hypothetical protein